MANTNDIVLTLVDILDSDRKIEIVVHKEKLKASCPYFNAALTNFKERHMPNITMMVPNISMMAGMINSLCGGVGGNDINDIAVILEYYQCVMFLGLDINFGLLDNIKICEGDYEILLQILDLVPPNEKLITIVNKNMPIKYDLSRITKKNLCLMRDAVRAKTKILLSRQDESCNSQRIELLDLESGEMTLLKYDMIDDSDDDIYDVYSSGDGSKVAFMHYKYIKICDILNNFVSFLETKKHIDSFHFSPTNDTFITMDVDGDIKIWNTVTCMEIKKITTSHTYDINDVCCVRYLPDGSRIYYVISGSFNAINAIEFYDLVTEKLISTINNDSPIGHVRHSPNGLYIAFCDLFGMVKIWDINKNFLIQTINSQNSDDICCLCFSNDSSKIAIGYYNGSIKIWDSVTMSTLFIYDERTTTIPYICFLPNDLSIAVSKGNIINIWDLSNPNRRETKPMGFFEMNDTYFITHICIYKKYQSEIERNILRFIENCE
jgi:WD40 repeat protein